MENYLESVETLKTMRKNHQGYLEELKRESLEKSKRREEIALTRYEEKILKRERFVRVVWDILQSSKKSIDYIEIRRKVIVPQKECYELEKDGIYGSDYIMVKRMRSDLDNVKAEYYLDLHFDKSNEVEERGKISLEQKFGIQDMRELFELWDFEWYNCKKERQSISCLEKCLNITVRRIEVPRDIDQIKITIHPVYYRFDILMKKINEYRIQLRNEGKENDFSVKEYFMTH